MRAGILLSVREKASRLPGKVLKPLGHCSTVTEFLIRRLKTAKAADAIIVATSDDPRDEVLCRIAEAAGVAAFRGSRDDKLLRYRDAAEVYGLDFLVIVDGDDPLVSPLHIDRIIAQARDAGGDFITCADLPLGATGFGLAVPALRLVCADRPESNTEVWGSWFTRDPRFRCLELPEPDPALRRPQYRLTLDYAEDYRLIAELVDRLGGAPDIPLEAVAALLDREPELAALNAGVAALYEAHLRASATG